MTASSRAEPIAGAHRLERLRFRFDDEDAFGVELGDGPTAETYLRTLRDHLATAVEVSPDVFGSIARLIDEVRDRLMPGERYTAFISNDPSPQAYCVAGNEPHTMILGMTAGLVRLLETDELRFVIGHEMGHYILGHNRRNEPDAAVIDHVNYRTLQRMAEISADRVGLVASGSVEHGVRAMVKTVSGIGDPLLALQVDGFLDRLRATSNEGVGDVYATHPLLSVRCRAIELFGRAAAFADLVGSGGGGLTNEAVDDEIASWMAESTGMHPTAVFETSVQRDLVWIATRLFIDDGRLSKAEQAVLRDTFGHELANQTIEFVRAHGPAAVATKFRDALDRLAPMAASARRSFAHFARQAASLAGGAEHSRLRLVEAVHRALRIDEPARLEPWDEVGAGLSLSPQSGRR